MRQWHPLFAQLLRPLVERYYEVQTTVPVGDVPREADLVLLRRTAAEQPPFQGLWKELTTWSVLEFKGPTVSSRVRDLDLLVELGLGIDRRLNAERVRQRQRPLQPEEVSLWYLANRLGHRFLREAQHRFGSLEAHGAGRWRSVVLRRSIFLVSSIALAVEKDTVPLHLVSREPPDTEVAVARLVVGQPALWETYNQWLRMLHPAAWQEVEGMARAARQPFTIDITPLVEAIGVKAVIEAIGVKPVIEAIGVKPVVEAIGVKPVVEAIGVKPVIEAIGVKPAIEAMGLKRILDEVGHEQVLKEMGVDDILAHLSPAQRAELKRKLR